VILSRQLLLSDCPLLQTMVAEDQLSAGAQQRLADLKLLIVKQELDRTQEDLQEAYARHAAATEQRRQEAEDLKERQRLRKEREAERKRRNEAAKKIAKTWKSNYLFRKQIAPLQDALQRRALTQSRHKLRTKLLDLRRNVHSLYIEDGDKLLAAVTIQDWWRGILFRRVEKVEKVYHKVQEVCQTMIAATSRIQALGRMRAAKRRTAAMREERMRSEEEAARRAEEVLLNSAIKVQSAYRKNKAIREVQRRRAQMFAAVLANGNENPGQDQAKPIDAGAYRSDRKAQGASGQRTVAKASPAKTAPKRKRPVSDMR